MIGHAVKAAVVTAVKVVKVLMTPKPITPEQEEILAKIAMSDRMLAKHWEWLKASGLVFTKRMWELTPRAELYASMITRVHGPDMDEAHELDLWYNVLRWCRDSRLAEEFVNMHVPIPERDLIGYRRKFRKFPR